MGLFIDGETKWSRQSPIVYGETKGNEREWEKRENIEEFFVFFCLKKSIQLNAVTFASLRGSKISKIRFEPCLLIEF